MRPAHRVRSGDFREEAMSLVNQFGYTRICEVGVWKGELSRMFATVATELILVDPMAESWNDFQADGFHYTCTMGEERKTQTELNVMYEQLVRDMPDARFLRMPSVLASLHVQDGSLDFVYIDAIHLYAYCLRDIKVWLPKLRSGGMLAGDDYFITGVSKAVDEMFGPQDTDRTWSTITDVKN